MELTEKQPIPWENRKELGIINAFLQTAQQVLFKPGEFFNNLEIKDSYLSPFYFFIISFFVQIAAEMIFSILFTHRKGFGENPAVLIAILVLGPLTIFIGAGFLHLGVLIFRGKGGFKATFNVLAYSSVAGLFAIIPFIGALIGGIWGIIVTVIGFKKAHDFSTARAILAYLGIYIFIALIALLAAIAIPNLLRARLAANESMAKVTVETISTAIEKYIVTNNGQYPLDEFVLKYAQPPYLDKVYNGKTIQGYIYSSSLNSSGYKISAIPFKCGDTGTKNFTIETKGRFLESNCNKK